MDSIWGYNEFWQTKARSKTPGGLPNRQNLDKLICSGDMGVIFVRQRTNIFGRSR